MNMGERVKILSDKDYPGNSKSSLICMLIHALEIVSETSDTAKTIGYAAIAAADEIMKKELKDAKDGK